jgi:CRP/FNR family cyclic AMP-dependent transcriptional regulator
MTAHTPREIKDHVAEHPFLKGLDAAFIRTALEGSNDRTYETGDLLVREGDPAHEFYLIHQGKVAIEIVAAGGPHLSIQTVGPGEVLGWSWLSPEGRWHFDARALKRTRVTALSADVLRRTFDERPADGYAFLLRFVPVLAERLENTRIQLLDIHGT